MLSELLTFRAKVVYVYMHIMFKGIKNMMIICNKVQVKRLLPKKFIQTFI